jgi:hypothetical protein
MENLTESCRIDRGATQFTVMGSTWTFLVRSNLANPPHDTAAALIIDVRLVTVQ